MLIFLNRINEIIFCFQRVSGLEDLQSQINQIKILTGSNLKLTSLPRSQLEDLDTGLGWEDLGTYGTTTATPSSSQNEHSRQHISDGYKPVSEPIREATREESPYAKQGGLKNMNMPSPTPRSVHHEKPKSPEQEENQNATDRRTPADVTENQNATDRRTPADVTPSDWRTPRSGGQSPVSPRAGNKSTMTEGIRSPENRSPNKTDRKSPQTGRQSKGYDTGRGEGSNLSNGNMSPENRSPGATNRSNQAQDQEN